MRNRSPTDCAWDVPLFIHSAYHFTVPWVSCTAEPPESFLAAYDFLFRVFFQFISYGDLLLYEFNC